MGNLDDKEPEVQSYLNKEYTEDDSTKRIGIVKEETQKVETVKDATQKVESVKDSIQKVELAKDATQKIDKIEEPIENKVEDLKAKVKKEKKLASLKKIILTRVLFIIIFAGIAIGLTIYFANKNGSNVLENINTKIDILINKQEENEISKKEKTVDLDGTYFLNSIEFREYQLDILDNKIEYLQIDGLKDDSVEIKINNEIKTSIEELSRKICEENKNAEIYSGCVIYANFANVISISFSISAVYDNSSVNEALYFNYDLVNGNVIELDDFFTEGFAMEEVLIDKLYEAVTTDYALMNEDTWELYVPEDVDDIEEIVYSIVSDYQRGKKLDFYFTPKLLNIKTSQYTLATILFKDYAENLVIYDKYLTSDSIFDGKYEGKKGLYTLTDFQSMYAMKNYIEEEGKNYYINVALFVGEEDIPDKMVETINNYIQDYVNKKKSEERVDGIFTIYNASFYMWKNDFNDNIKYNVNVEESSYDTTKSKYTHSIKPSIKEFFRQDFSDWPEFIGNLFLPRLNYYDEIINSDDVTYDYYNIELDTIGNIISVDGVPVTLETID